MNTEKLETVKSLLSDINRFGDHLIRIPLLNYQRSIADAITKSVLGRDGATITVEMPRQSGKNQISATVESFMLIRRYITGGCLIKTAPTFTPQLSISKNRLTSILDRCPLTSSRWKLKDGNTITLGRARLMMLSAQPTANVVGATADIAMFVDEGQEIDTEKFERDFSPMKAWRNAPLVVYGVRWDGDSFLERLIAMNLEKEKRDGIKRHFRVEPDMVIAENPAYKKHFDKEVARLGSDHILIKTQYLLESVSAIGDFFTPAQIVSMRGDFGRCDVPYDGHEYYAGIDIGGQAMDIASKDKHDETIMVIAAKSKSRHSNNIDIVNCFRWRGASWEKLHREIMTLLDHFRPARVVVDSRGIGNACAMRIAENYKYGAVEAYQATSASVSDDGYYLMSIAGFQNLKIFNDSDSSRSKVKLESNLVSTDDIFRQLSSARRELIGNSQMRFYVPERSGHDDILKALSYAVRAARFTKSNHERVLLEAVID